MIQEINIHRSVHHKHIVGFHGYFEDADNVYIVLELCRRRVSSFLDLELCLGDLLLLTVFSLTLSLSVCLFRHRPLRLGSLTKLAVFISLSISLVIHFHLVHLRQCL